MILIIEAEQLTKLTKLTENWPGLIVQGGGLIGIITVDHDYMISDWDDYSDWRALA